MKSGDSIHLYTLQELKLQSYMKISRFITKELNPQYVKLYRLANEISLAIKL